MAALQEVQSGLVRRIAKLYEQAGQAQRMATVDQDATIIESHKEAAYYHYEEGRGYQPMVAVWAEADLVLADEFRDGNVPGLFSPLTCAKAAFAALPANLTQWGFRGDTACYENQLLRWLDDLQRDGGPKGRIEYAIGAPCHAGLLQSMHRVKETDWITQETEEDGTQRQWADLDYVPSLKYEGKDLQPRRYIGIRLLKPQGILFADGSDRQHHTVVTNRTESGDRVLDWHREKAGTIEQVHDQVKNGLGGGRMPSGKFGANAAWFRIACIAFNVILALRAKWPDEELRTAHMKRLRFRIFHVTGRVVRDRRKFSLRVSASREWIQKLQALFDAFPLVTQATG